MKEKSKPKRRKEPASKESMSEKVETKMAPPPAPPVSVRSAAREEVHTRVEKAPEQEQHHHHHHHEEAHEKHTAGGPCSLQDFVRRFVPCNQRGEPLPIQNWNDIVNKPGVMMSILGQGKTWALAAAHQQKCWTVMKLGENKFQVEAGMNTSEATKIGYLATQKPWDSLETTVA